MTSTSPPASSPQHRVRICCIAGRYLVFDIKDVAHLRRNHNISSIFVGTLPQSATQNVFLGLPVELFAEEAKLLVQRGVAYVVDDAAAHLSKLSGLDAAGRRAYAEALRERQREVRSAMAVEGARRAAASSEQEKRARSKKKQKVKKASSEGSEEKIVEKMAPEMEADDFLFLISITAVSATRIKGGATPGVTRDASKTPSSIRLTPTTSADLIGSPYADPNLDADADSNHNLDPSQITAPESYYLLAHLNSLGYYATPGLRFGGHYSIYPGDPFRFHAHFLAVGLRWDEEIPMLDFVTRGRLGTSVKKSFLFGGGSLGERTLEEQRLASAAAARMKSRSPTIRMLTVV